MKPNSKVLAGLFAVLLVVAGCSSSTKSTSPTGAAGSAVPIKIGLLGSFTSATAVAGSDVVAGEDAVKAWAEAVNASGGIDGHPVQLTVEDDGTNPATALTDAQTLVADHEDAVMDLSNVDQAFGPTLQSADIPVVGASLPEAEEGANPDFFPEGETNASSYYAVALLAKESGATNLGIIYCVEAPQCAELVSPMKAQATTVGVPVTYTASISATAPDYTAQCVAAKQQHVTALYLGEVAAVGARFIQDCQQQGYDPTYVMTAAAYSAVLASTPGASNHLWLVQEDVPSSSALLATVLEGRHPVDDAGGEPAVDVVGLAPGEGQRRSQAVQRRPVQGVQTLVDLRRGWGRAGGETAGLDGRLQQLRRHPRLEVILGELVLIETNTREVLVNG